MSILGLLGVSLVQVNVCHYPFLALSKLIEVREVEAPSSPTGRDSVQRLDCLDSHTLIVLVLSCTLFSHRTGPKGSAAGTQGPACVHLAVP